MIAPFTHPQPCLTNTARLQSFCIHRSGVNETPALIWSRCAGKMMWQNNVLIALRSSRLLWAQHDCTLHLRWYSQDVVRLINGDVDSHLFKMKSRLCSLVCCRWLKFLTLMKCSWQVPAPLNWSNEICWITVLITGWMANRGGDVYNDVIYSSFMNPRLSFLAPFSIYPQHFLYLI